MVEADTRQPFDPVAYINAPRWRDSSFGLDRIRLLLDKLGDPQDDLRFVHVAGTNGKGSICAYLASILSAAGYRTGLFTSPYIERFEERIQVDGKMISEEDLKRITLKIRDAADEVEAQLGEHPTEFELMCAVALEHFRNAACDIVVMEVGLGGRLDATNVIMPDVSVIARIGFDHMDYLGDTIAGIAAEKAGIIKHGVPVVSYPQEQEAMRVIEDVAEENDSAVTWPIFEQLDEIELDLRKGTRSFEYRGALYETSMLGSYQPKNAAVAIEAIRALQRLGWKIGEDAIQEGISHARWPGRFEILRADPLLIVDGAHNPQGAQALADSIEDLRLERASSADPHDAKIVFVMGVLADKDYEDMIAPLVPYARAFITYAPDNLRALSAADLRTALERQVPQDVPVLVAGDASAAVSEALSLTEMDDADIIVAYGSLYSVGEIRRAAERSSAAC